MDGLFHSPSCYSLSHFYFPTSYIYSLSQIFHGDSLHVGTACSQLFLWKLISLQLPTEMVGQILLLQVEEEEVVVEHEALAPLVVLLGYLPHLPKGMEDQP